MNTALNAANILETAQIKGIDTLRTDVSLAAMRLGLGMDHQAIDLAVSTWVKLYLSLRG